MTEIEAYPCGRSDGERARTTYESGDRVHIGPGYRGNGQWVNESGQGEYYILRRMDVGADYYLARERDGEWEYICHASRLCSHPHPQT